MTWDFAEANPLQRSVAASGRQHRVGGRRVADVPAAAAGDMSTSSMHAHRIVRASGVSSSTDPPVLRQRRLCGPLRLLLRVAAALARHSSTPISSATLLTPKTAELVADTVPVRWRRERAESTSRRGLRAAFARIAAGADPTFPVTVYYAFKQAESRRRRRTATAARRVNRLGDDARGAARRRASQSIGTWPIRTERAGRSLDRDERSRLVDRPRLPASPRRCWASRPGRTSSLASSARCPRRCGRSSTATSRRSTSRSRRSGPGWRSSAATRRCSSPTARRCASARRSRSSTRSSTRS